MCWEKSYITDLLIFIEYLLWSNSTKDKNLLWSVFVQKQIDITGISQGLVQGYHCYWHLTLGVKLWQHLDTIDSFILTSTPSFQSSKWAVMMWWKISAYNCLNSFCLRYYLAATWLCTSACVSAFACACCMCMSKQE